MWGVEITGEVWESVWDDIIRKRKSTLTIQHTHTQHVIHVKIKKFKNKNKMTQFSPRPLLVTAVSLNGAHQTSHEERSR